MTVLGGVAMLLWGLRMVRTGVMRAFGADLRRFLGRGLRNRFTALLSGLTVTALLQSSTATALMTASFAARGVVAAAPALAIMLGADLGSALVAQLLAFRVSWLPPLLLVVGVSVFFSSSTSVRKDVGRIVIGLGLLLWALRLIVEATAPLQHAQAMDSLFLSLGGEPLIVLLGATLLTWLAHSSLAVVLLTMSLVSAGVLSGPLAYLVVLGANLGGGVTPLVATLSASPTGRRVPAGNLIFKVCGVAAALPFVAEIERLLTGLGIDPAWQVVQFHILFNVVLAAAFIGLVGPVSRLVARLLPESETRDEPAQPRHLDHAAIATPTVAVANAVRETLRMGDVIETMLRHTMSVLRHDDRRLLEEVERMDDVVDSLHEAIKFYVTEVQRQGLSKADSRRCTEIITFTTNLEHIGDIIDRNLLELASKKIKKKLSFSEEGFGEIEALHQALLDNIQIAFGVFMSRDVDMASRLLEEKVRFRDQEMMASESHLGRLRSGRVESIDTSSLHLDILRDFKRINSHLTSVAYPILEEAGLLESSRLKRAREIKDAQRAAGE